MRTRGSPDAEHDAHRDEPDHRVPSVEGTDEDDASGGRNPDDGG